MKYFFSFICLLILCPDVFSDTTDGSAGMEPNYTLAVSFDIPHSRLDGMARIAVNKDEELIFDVSNLSILDVTLDGVKIDHVIDHGEMISRTLKLGELKIVYTASFGLSKSDTADIGIIDNVIAEQGIFLTGTWYPRPRRLMAYRLSAVLPSGYEAVSEAERIDSTAKDGKSEFTFLFDHRTDHLNFIASNRFSIVKERFGEIDLYAYFFDKDMNLAKDYLEHAKRYFDLYQKMLTPYPYRRFSIVENILPTGYSMPTFTLLGRDVVKLPFIVRTSLGHEILHQWFGNSVYIDSDKGNWAEGLTTYLADHFYADQSGEGVDYRKQILIDYQSYVNIDNVFPLRDFRGRTDFSSKAIGYGKAAMLFHMLKQQIGEVGFQGALRRFLSDNSFRKASWDDLKSSFAVSTGTDWGDFFDQWLNSTTVPDLTAGSAIVRQKGEGYEISFDLRQKTKPFTMTVPVTIYESTKKETIPSKISREMDTITLYSRELPERIVIDEGYDVMRRLYSEEFPAVIARILGDAGPMLILPQSEIDTYKKIIETFVNRGASIKKGPDIDHSLAAKNTLIILGADNPILKRFGGAPKQMTGGFTLDVRRNPLNRDKVIAIINAESTEEVDSAFPKIFHYGKYSRLAFSKGKNILKETDSSQKGLTLEIEAEAAAVHVPDMKDLSQVITAVGDRRIVYVGENHDNYANHAVQLEFIKDLSGSGVQITIGMEMFQKPFQPVLDEFIKGSIDQKTFLKKTEYFKRWGFDYDLYKPILDYARDNRIPVIALNIEKEIVDSVAKDGIDALPPDVKAKIPQAMDFSDEQYKKRLQKIFMMHESLKERNFDFFNQAQILWDESMSQSIADYLSSHPDRRMIVLAGNGHLTYGSGIPKRTARRNGLSYAIVLNDDELVKGIADYVVFPKHIEGKKPVRMMVLLDENKGRVTITGFPENSISKKAGLEEGDIIMFIDDTPISSIDDVKIHLLEKHNEEKIRVKILRGYGGAAKDMQFEITL